MDIEDVRYRVRLICSDDTQKLLGDVLDAMEGADPPLLLDMALEALDRAVREGHGGSWGAMHERALPGRGQESALRAGKNRIRRVQ